MSDVGEQNIVEALGEIKVKVLRWAWALVGGLVMTTAAATATWTKQSERVDTMQKERAELARAVSDLNLTLRELSTTLREQDRRISRLEETRK